MTLAWTDALALFAAMLVLAAVPGVSVLAVTARAAAAGFRQGAWLALGIVAGDTLFIVLVIFGLHALAAASAPAYDGLRAAAALCLLWLARSLWRAPLSAPATGDQAAAARSAFLSGLLLTLGDQKALLFYLGFFPALIDLARLTWADALAVIAIAAVAVGGVKLGYAAVAAGAGLALGAGWSAVLNHLAALLLLAPALILLAGLWDGPGLWLGIKIAVFYGAPPAAGLAAFAWMLVLALRVRGGKLERRRAAWLYLWAWLAPAAALLPILLTGEAAGYFSSTLAQYRWDGQRLLDLLQSLLPVGGYVAVVVFALHLLLLVLLALLPSPRKA
jgi:threonine/homoserine/homoserine lactone efflux protein